MTKAKPGKLMRLEQGRDLGVGNLQPGRSPHDFVRLTQDVVVFVVRQSTSEDYPFSPGCEYIAESYVVVLFEEKLWLARKTKRHF